MIEVSPPAENGHPPELPVTSVPLAPVPTRSHREICLEVIVVLAAAWFPYFAYSAFPGESEAVRRSFVVESAWSIVNTLPIIAVVLYVMYRSELPWSAYGIKRPRLLIDPLSGALIWLATATMLGLVYGMASIVMNTENPSDIGRSSYDFQYPADGVDMLVLACLVVVIGLSEEIAMRGYLIPRLEQLLNSTVASVLVSSLFFASYHLYQGIGPAIGIFFIGLAFGTAFAWQRRLWPVAIAHAIMDIAAFAVPDVAQTS